MHKEYTICSPQEEALLTVSINEGSKRHYELGESDYITLIFSLNDPMYIPVGSYVTDPRFGQFVFLDETYKPTYNTSTGGYDYEMQFDAWYCLFKKYIFKYQPSTGAAESSWQLTDGLDVFMQIFTANLKALGITYNKADYVANIDTSKIKAGKQSLTFADVSLYDALSNLAEAFECEWWIEDNQIYFGKCELSNNEAIEFKLGGKCLSINSTQSSDDNHNRYYVFGSDRNITKKYRKNLIFRVSNVDSTSKQFYDANRPLKTDMIADEAIDGGSRYVTISKNMGGFTSGSFTPLNNVITLSQTIGEIQPGEYEVIALPTYRLTVYKDGTKGWSKRVKVLFHLLYDTEEKDADGDTTTTTNTIVLANHEQAIPAYDTETLYTIYKNVETFQIPSGAKNAFFKLTFTFIFDGDNGNINTAALRISDESSDTADNIYATIRTKNYYFRSTLKLTYFKDLAAVQSYFDLLGQDKADEAAKQILYTDEKVVNNPTADSDGQNVLVASGTLPTVGYYYIIDGDLLAKGEVPAYYYTGLYSEDIVANGVVQSRLMLPKSWNNGKNYIDSFRYDSEGNLVPITNSGYFDGTNGEDSDKPAFNGDTSEMDIKEVNECVLTIDDVYPQTECVITDVTTDEVTVKNDDDGSTSVVTRYNIKWSGSPTSIRKSDISENKNLAIRFGSVDGTEGTGEGHLIGMEFEVNLNDSSTDHKQFQIVINDDYGRDLPDTVLCPTVGDKFVFLNWDVSLLDEKLVLDAETELLHTAIDEIRKKTIDPNVYDCTMFEDALATDEKVDEAGDSAITYGNKVYEFYRLGQPVRLILPTMIGGERLSRIIGWEFPLDIPVDNPVFYVGESVAYSKLSNMQDQIDELTYNGSTWQSVGSGGSGSSVYVIAKGDSTTPTDTNVYSAKMSDYRYLSSLNNDTANGIITFLKGLKLGSDGKYYIDEKGQAALSEILTDMLEAGEIRTEYLTVTKAAHFFKLIVDEMKSTSGTIINTAANCVLDRVDAYDADGAIIADDDPITRVDHWRCYWKAEDGDGRAISNQWEVDDQAICYTCNLAEGTTYDASNNYWWRLVTGTGSESTCIDGTAYNCHYMDVSNTTYDGGEYTGLKSGCPAVGDNVAQLGNRTDKERQGAIIFAAYNTPDEGIVSPSFCQYVGITDFDLSSHRWTWFARNGNKIRGNFEVNAGMGAVSYTHYAYSDSLDYSENLEWRKGDMGGRRWKYKGTVATTEQGDGGLDFNDYSWEEIFYPPVYSVELSQYADSVCVDAEGNVIGGLWKEVANGTDTDRLYTVSSALFVKKNGVPLLETDDDKASEGFYRIASVDAYDCTFTHVNGGGFAITGISNCHDGVAATSEDIDFDAMRLMYRCELRITVELEATDEVRIVSMPVIINHSNEAYVATELDNDMAAATYNTVSKMWIGLGECKATVTKRHGTDKLAITGLEVSGYSGMTVTADKSTGEVKIDSVSDTTPRTENVKITSTCKYAGISYENEKIWTVVIRNGNANYQLSLNTQFVTFTDGVADIPAVIASVYGIGEGDEITEISNPSDYNLVLSYSVDDEDHEIVGSSVSPSVNNRKLTFFLRDSEDNLWDSEDASIVITVRTIVETKTEYQLSYQGTTVPTGTWSSSPLEQTVEQPYLWTRITIEYNYGAPDYSYSVSKIGESGENAWSFVITPERYEIDDYKDVDNSSMPDVSGAVFTVYATKGDTTNINPSSIVTTGTSYCTAEVTSTGVRITGILKKSYTYTASDGTTKTIEMYADSGYVDFNATFGKDDATVTHSFRGSFTCSVGAKYAKFNVTIDGITSEVVDLETRTNDLENGSASIWGDYSTTEQTAAKIESEVGKLEDSVNAKFSEVEQTATGISSRVTNIEDDYIQKSELDINAEFTSLISSYFDNEGKLLNTSGLVTTATGSGLYAQVAQADGTYKVALVGVGVEESDDDGNTQTVIKLTADNIKLEGLVTANENFKIQEDGSIVAKNGTFEGTLKGVNGTFTELSTSCGDFHMQGTKDNRSLRFYASDIWCRGSFGAYKRNTVFVHSDYAKYYSEGISESPVEKNLSSSTDSAGNTYYELSCYGSSTDGVAPNDDTAGFPVDTIIFSRGTSDTYNYLLQAASSQRLLLVNAADEFNNVQIYSNGKLVSVDAGMVMEVVQISPDFMNPTKAANTLGRGLFVCSTYDNDWR